MADTVEAAEAAAATACQGCGSELAPALRACPRCQRLVHGAALSALAAEAERASADGDHARALAAWRRALDLLPAASEQSRRVAEKIVALSAVVSERATSGSEAHPSWVKRGSAIGVASLFLWKFKFAVVFVATKLKFLALGLTKIGTVLSMALSVGVYWTIWGWPFALSLVLAMYVHEMGHVAALRRFGIAATAPMFVPGLGAFVRLKQTVQTPAEDSRVGLAGPIWGLGASLALYVSFLATGVPLLAAVAKFSAWINLFNLLPVWQLDGGRGFQALSRGQRWTVVASMGLAWWFTKEGLLPLLLLAAVAHAWGARAPERGDAPVLVQFIGLVLTLSLLTTIPVPAVS